MSEKPGGEVWDIGRQYNGTKSLGIKLVALDRKALGNERTPLDGLVWLY